MTPGAVVTEPMTDIRALRLEELPLRWGRYELHRLLGEGGLGRVYGGELIGPAGFRKPVALKVVRPRPGAEAMLLAEARLGARLQHPHIAQIYDLGERDGSFFLAMERVDGPDLARVLASRGPLPGAALLDLARQVCDALAYAHALRLDGRVVEVVHRDLKPSNLLVDDRGRVCLVDFGIAIVRDLGQGGAAAGVAGTPGYLAPEQARGEPMDARSDLFSLGVCLIEAATGRRPWRSEEAEAAYMALAQPADALRRWGLFGALEGIAPGFGGVIADLLHRDPERRTPRASALRERLASLPGAEGPDLRLWMAADLGDPELTDPGVEDTFAWVSAGERPGSAEATVNVQPFIGRAQELSDIERALRAGERLITLEGMGGVGKTRLARQAALRFGDRLARGARFVDLSEARTEADVVRELAAVMDLRLPGPGAGHAALLEARLGDAGPQLLVLDGVEGVVGPLAALVEAWSFAAPELRMLVTGRQALGLLDEHRLEVSPLPREDAMALYRELAPSAALSEPLCEPRLSALVDTLDRLPLAIVLAAARGGEGEELLQRLLDEADAAGDGPGGRSNDRHSTLHATLSWSWSLLEPWEQALFAQLSVFEGVFSAEAVGAVVDLSAWPDAPWSVIGLESLIDKHVIATVPEYSDPPRFRLPRSVRMFAAARLREPGAIRAPDGRSFSKPEADFELGRRHAAFYSSVDVERSAAGARAPSWRWKHQLLTLDRGNIVAAMDWATAAGAEEQLVGCARLVGTLASYQGPLDEGMARIERALELPGLSGGARQHMRFYHAKLRALRGEREEALAQALQASEAQQGSPDLAGRALQFAAYLLSPYDWDRAEDYATRSLQMLSPDGKADCEQWSLNILGVVAFRRGDLSRAEALLQRTVATARRVSDFRCEAASMTVLADLHQHGLGDPRRAARYHEVCTRLSTRMEDSIGMAVGFINFAQAWIACGELRRAEQAIEEAERLAAAAGMGFILEVARSYRAQLALYAGRLDEAERLAEAVLAALSDDGNEASLCARAVLSERALLRGRPEDLLPLWEGAALSGYQAVDRGLWRMQALLALGELDGAAAQLAELEALLEGSRNLSQQAAVLAVAATHAAASGEPERARALSEEAEARAAVLNLTPQAPLSLLLGRVGAR